ncbi:MAG: tetratricopeptide repeat protein, partial [Pseudomonadales bacterium]|nr:tetratricopeptide repeat protein [Pseudomonadales bacterium]
IDRGLRIIVGLVLIALVFVALAWAQHPPEDGGGDDVALVVEIRRLRTEAHDYPACQQLAERFLAQHPAADLLRQAAEYEQAASYYAERNWDAARPLFEALVAEYAEQPLDTGSEWFLVDDARCMIGVIKQYSNDPAGATEAYEQLLAEYPASNRAAYALLQLGGIYERAGDHATSLARYKRLAADYPDSGFADDAQFFIAGLLRARGDFAEAIALLDALPTQWPESEYAASALFIAAQTRADTGDYAAAIQQMEQFIVADPAHRQAPEAQTQIADLYRRQAQFDLAVAAYEQVPARWPESPFCAVALQDLNRTLMEQDGTAWGTGQLPRADQTGHLATIESNLERMLAQYPSTDAAPTAMLDVINFCVQPAWWQGGLGLEMRARVRGLAERLVQLYPDTTQGWAARAELATAVADTDPDRAAALLDACIDHASSTGGPAARAGALFGKAVFLQNRGELETARSLWQEALEQELDPVVEAEAKLCLASAHARADDADAALALFDQVAAADAYPRDVRASALILKAWTLRRVQRVEEARDLLQDVVAQFPGETAAATASDLLLEF